MYVYIYMLGLGLGMYIYVRVRDVYIHTHIPPLISGCVWWQGEFVRFHEVLQRMQDFIFESLYNRHALEHRLRVLQVGGTKTVI